MSRKKKEVIRIRLYNIALTTIYSLAAVSLTYVIVQYCIEYLF